MKYLMTEKGNDIRGFWKNCKATTAKGAKAEATRTLGKGYHHHTLVIAIEHEDGQIEEMASRPMTAKKWLTV